MDQPKWSRFTLLDALLCFPVYSLAFATVHMTTAATVRDSHVSAGIAIREFLFGLGLGSAFLGPVILGSHYLFRGRKRRLGVGEWLWVAPIYFAVCALTVRWAVGAFLPTVLMQLFGILVAIAFVVFVNVALIMLFVHVFDKTSDPPCYWADCFGCVVCIASAGLLWIARMLG